MSFQSQQQLKVERGGLSFQWLWPGGRKNETFIDTEYYNFYTTLCIFRF